MKKIAFAICFLLIVSFVFAVEANAQSQSATSSPQAVVVATVNIYNAQIVSQNGNNFKISFDLNNRTNIQPGIKYGVQLLQSTTTAQQYMADEKVYPEVITLYPNETQNKSIDYSAPAYLNGKYDLWLVAKNESGLLLALSRVGEVSLSGNNQYVEILASSCYIKKENSQDKHYLMEGVAVAPGEKLFGVCDIQNHFSSAVTLMPSFESYYRDSFGNKVDVSNPVYDPIAMKAGEKKTVFLPLPLASEPQAYNAELSLLQNNQEISNSVSFHYVISGQSATIQNITLDKDYYAKGDTARISFFWTPAADSGTYGNVILSISAKNSSGQSCFEISSSNPVAGAASLDASVTADCLNPVISAVISDSSGKVLSQQGISLTSKNPPAPPKLVIATIPIIWFWIGGVVVIAIIILIILFVFLRKKKNKTNKTTKPEPPDSPFVSVPPTPPTPSTPPTPPTDISGFKIK